MKWWKRFAFFERNNYSLPQQVIDDILPVHLFAENSSGMDETSIARSSSGEEIQVDGDKISLSVINGAGIPVESWKQSTPAKDPSHGIHGMIRTLATCSEYHSVTEDGSNDNNNESQARDSFRFSASGHTLDIPSKARKSGNVDGSLVLAFLGSQSSCRVHCVDMTMRCNPLHKKEGINLSTKSGSSSRHGAATAKLNKNEDLDGWRGYFQPFAHDYVSSPSASSSVSDANNTGQWLDSEDYSRLDRLLLTQDRKIVQTVCCSDHETDNFTLGKNIYVASISDAQQSIGVTVQRNPHLYLNDLDVLEDSKKGTSSLSMSSNITPKQECFQPLGKFDQKYRGKPRCVDIKPGLVAVGTEKGMVILYEFRTGGGNASSLGGCNGTNKLTVLMEIPSPNFESTVLLQDLSSPSRNRRDPTVEVSNVQYAVSSLKLVFEKCNESASSNAQKKKSRHVKLFVTYCRSKDSDESISQGMPSQNKSAGGGVCCFDIGVIGEDTSNNSSLLSPNNRHDLDSRETNSSCLCDLVLSGKDLQIIAMNADDTTEQNHDDSSDTFMIARPDGLYTYSPTEKISVSAIDGSKTSMCSIPPPPVSRKHIQLDRLKGGNQELLRKLGHNDEEQKNHEDSIINIKAVESGASYVLIATKDKKSGRDAVDVYDISNKLVAFHILLSPGHKALRSVGVTTAPKPVLNGFERGGLSSSVILTSGGSIVSLTEKVTAEKVSLLVQKNLYSAAISMAFADPTFKASDITNLFKKYAEHLYRKGDFSASMNQYLHTIGSLEPSHVIYRFLDAPKVPLLTKYLEALRSRDLATSVHLELLKTCYQKVNDVAMAEKISASLSKAMDSNTCNSMVTNLLHTPVEALATLCSFQASQVVDVFKAHGAVLAKALPKETAGIVISLCDGTFVPASNEIDSKSAREKEGSCDKYPVHLFSSAFLENPKMLRVILAHCEKKKYMLDPSLKRMLLELTLEEWNYAKRMKDADTMTLRRQEVISLLSSHSASDELGDYESLVIVQQQDFVEGIIMLYERLQMAPLLIEKYAEDGSYKARRQMLAMCRSDPELIADVLGHFVRMISEKKILDDEEQSISSDSDIGELLDDVREGLSMALAQGILPPIRIIRILAGNGIGQFTEERKEGSNDESNGVPLSVALDYVSDVMDEQSKKIERLKMNIEDFNNMCNDMEEEINALQSYEKSVKSSEKTSIIDIDGMYNKLLDAPTEISSEKKTELVSELFWREMEQSSDRFDTIARFFAKDVLE